MKKIIIIVSAVLILIALISVIIFAFGSDENIEPNENGHIITQFSLSESWSNDMAEPGGSETIYFSLYENSLNIETSEPEKNITIKLDKQKREKLEQELLALIETYSLKKWNGYDEWMDVLDDFHDFTLNIEYANGKEIYAHGDHMFPENYNDVFDAVQAIFLNYE